jgi:predicted lactoylglutathione lyase
MIKQICLNVPVADLAKSRTFFHALGFAENPAFTGEACAMIVISESIAVMLTTHAQFRQYTPKAVCDTSQAVEALFNLGCGSREDVDRLVAKALAAGGSTYDKPEDFGFMYTHSFVDPDGHGWGLFCMSTPPAAEG